MTCRDHGRLASRNNAPPACSPGGCGIGCRASKGIAVAQFHFVEDYERVVAHLLQTYPLDEAMSMAVGGRYEETGKIEAAVIRHAGLTDGMALLDMGCGSGRLAAAISKELSIYYTGIDIVQALLDYAASKSPTHYRFIKSHSLAIPMKNGSVDMVCAFSLFTHLLHAETYLYLEECRRILKPGGSVVFSFLEFANPGHWQAFATTVDAQRREIQSHLTQFIELPTIRTWAKHLGFSCEYIAGNESPWQSTPALGQSIAILRKR